MDVMINSMVDSLFAVCVTLGKYIAIFYRINVLSRMFAYNFRHCVIPYCMSGLISSFLYM